MKKDIHPDYKETTIVCACGATFHTRSTKPKFTIDICSQCHPFYTGKQKLVDSAGRVERFKKRYSRTKKGQEKKVAPDITENVSKEKSKTDISEE